MNNNSWWYYIQGYEDARRPSTHKSPKWLNLLLAVFFIILLLLLGGVIALFVWTIFF